MAAFISTQNASVAVTPAALIRPKWLCEIEAMRKLMKISAA